MRGYGFYSFKMTGNGLRLASRSDLLADGPDFSGQMFRMKVLDYPQCRLGTALSGGESAFSGRARWHDYMWWNINMNRSNDSGL